MIIDLGKKSRYKPKTISCSGIKTYHQCPLKFYFQYIERLPIPENEYFLRGTLVHSVFEQFHKQIPPVNTKDINRILGPFKDRAVKLLNQEWGKIGIDYKDSFSHEPFQMQKEYNMQKNWVEFYALQQALRYVEIVAKVKYSYTQAMNYFMPYYVEVPLYDYDLGINGRIDAVYKLPYINKYYPLDYKTSVKLATTIDEGEEMQLYIYALLLRNCEQKICTEGHIYLARTASEPIIYLNDKKMAEIEALCVKASEVYSSRDIGQCERNKNVFCRWCPYSQIQCKDIVRKPKVYVMDYSSIL